MKKKLRGLKRREIQLDFNLYRVEVPIPDLADAFLSVIDIWPEAAESTILFIHGYAGVAETWEYQLNYFMRNHRVVAPDLRGHGQSDAPFTRYDMPELVADIETIVDVLSLPDKFVLVGHSFGGSICVEYAAAHPDRLSHLVTLTTAGEYPLPRATSLLSRVPTAAFRPWWRYRPRWNAEIHVMKRMMLNNMRTWKGWDLLPKIQTPTLVITGEKDRYFPRGVYERFSRSIPGAEVLDIGASKHKVQLERYEAVNRAIDRFIQPDDRAHKASWRSQLELSGQEGHRPWLTSYGKHTPHTIPIPRQPLTHFLETAANWLPNRTAIVFYTSTLTYQQLDRRVNQFAHALQGLGIQPGDRVMIVLPNIPNLVIAYYAILKAGGVVVLPNPDADAPQIFDQINSTGSKVLVTLTDFGELIQGVGENTDVQIVLADIRDMISNRTFRQLNARWAEAGFSREEGTPSAEQFPRMDELMMDTPREAPTTQVGVDDLAAVLFTSGTTDEPKGVRLTHRNLVANAMQTRHWIPELEMGKETFIAVIPLTHSYGMTSAMNIPIALAGTIVLMPVFELEEVLKQISTHKPTLFPGVPSIYMAINQAKNVRSYGLSSIKACISGAAPLPIEVQEKFEKLTRGRLVEGYGLTEASPVTHANPFHPTEKVGSMGIPIPNTDAKIVDLITGEDLPPGEIGELLVKGPQVMQGYWESEQTSDSDDGVRDGWLYTGDVAVMDQDGFFTIISRKRDTIMAGEFSVYPRDVEEVLYENSKVMEVAVVGVQTKDGGQRVKAFVVPRSGVEISEDELLELCRKRLEPYAVPWDIEFRESLPKSFVGKVLRRMLVEEDSSPG